MTYTVDPKLLPWFVVGIVVWMAFVVCVGYFGSRGRHDGEKFVTGGRDMNAFLIFCTLGVFGHPRRSAQCLPQGAPRHPR